LFSCFGFVKQEQKLEKEEEEDRRIKEKEMKINQKK
jgi:hypothetical protein